MSERERECASVHLSGAGCLSVCPGECAWQTDPPLQSNVTIDTSHHCPRLMHCLDGWELWQSNGRIWISEHSSRVVKMDTAQCGKLLAMFAGGRGQDIATVEFLQLLRDSSYINRRSISLMVCTGVVTS